MVLFDNIFSLIDMRSFTSIWFWIILALFWSAATNSVLGVSHGLIVRARKQGGDVMQDVHVLVDIHVRQKLYLTERIGHWVTGFAVAILCLIFMLAFVYRLELAQALFLLLLPLMLIQLMLLRLAFRIDRQKLRDGRLLRALLRHRLWVQIMGIVWIFITAIWGMYRLMTTPVLF